jgi:hypothetical protein
MECNKSFRESENSMPLLGSETQEFIYYRLALLCCAQRNDRPLLPPGVPELHVSRDERGSVVSSAPVFEAAGL